VNDDRDPRRIPFRAMIPNAITALALCRGLTGVSLAIGGQWEKRLARSSSLGVLDGLDGRIARLLRAESKFGAELDSLSDTYCVRNRARPHPLPLVAENGAKVWLDRGACALVCCALRLARFNARLDAAEQLHKSAGFNTGSPAAWEPVCNVIPI
jgi:CDP-diacylglycerol--serine O-phosphatidyltransferase